MSLPTPQYGATRAEWNLFANTLGLLPDLLPVVCRPGQPIAEGSKLKEYGKTPSKYTHGKVTGILGWTAKQTNYDELRDWQNREDYGICVQTRRVRGIDIDIGDAIGAQQVVQYITDKLGHVLPLRTRENSGKCLIPILVPGELQKRIIRTELGNIEFLANGQQFIAAGTHTSGVRYTWSWPDGEKLWQLSPEDFEIFWAGLAETFGKEGSVDAQNQSRKTGAAIAVDDPIARRLEAKGIVKGYGREGQLHIICPWKHEHSMDGGEAETVYFPKGTRGYEQGHFHCFHACCAKRTDGDYTHALGLHVDDFEVETIEGEAEPWPVLRRTKKGKPEGNIANLKDILRAYNVTGLRLRYDTFLDEIIIFNQSTGTAAAMRDKLKADVKIWLDRKGFNKPADIDLRDAMINVAEEDPLDSGRDWLRGLEWDGVPRCQMFFKNYMGADDSDYTRAVGLYLWSALAGRVMAPGCQVDMVPILTGAQGLMKSSAVRAIAPFAHNFMEFGFNDIGDNLSRRMRGVMVAEVAELQGMQTREAEHIKAFVTRRYEELIKKYQEFKSNYPRRVVFIGTSNEHRILTDTTGNRRWLPVQVVRPTDPAAIARDRVQLWAEGRALFQEHGVMWRDAENLGRQVQERQRMVGPFEEAISVWLHTPDCDLPEGAPARLNGERPIITNQNILEGALRMPMDRVKGFNEIRQIEKIMPLMFYRRVEIPNAFTASGQHYGWTLDREAKAAAERARALEKQKRGVKAIHPALE
jgi:hypothetical protein